MKILYITTIGGTMGFFTSLIRHLLDEGHTVDIATNEKVSKVPVCYREWGCAVYQIDTSRSPFDTGNVKAIGQIKQLAERGNYDIVHCHTPVAAACTRLACIGARKKGTRVFYTAHGFHFYTGSPIKNWLLYYPIEWVCSWFTDTLITINKEDFERASKHLHAKRTEYVPGVGIDTEKFGKKYNGAGIRNELGITNFMLLSVGELNDNKNHGTVIRAISGLDLTYVIVGQGEKQKELENLACECDSNVILTGYRTDVADFYSAADAYILPSIREGLNVSLMEAMSSGLPCLCGNIRGNIDLIDKEGGILFNPESVEQIRRSIQRIIGVNSKTMGAYNKNKIKNFDKNKIVESINDVYKDGGGVKNGDFGTYKGA